MTIYSREVEDVEEVMEKNYTITLKLRCVGTEADQERCAENLDYLMGWYFPDVFEEQVGAELYLAWLNEGDEE